jgi:ketosteroid isomerase-like protein
MNPFPHAGSGPQRERVSIRLLMQIFITATAGLIVLVCVPLLALAQDAPSVGTASNITALEHAWVDGQSRNDNGALNLIFDNALVYIEYGKLVTKGEYLSRVRTANSKEQMVVLEGMTVRVLGSTAIVIGTYRDKGPKGSTTSVVRWRFVDTWVKKDGNWKLVAAASAPLR